ncbi:MAG: hypothetical protein LBS35_00830, partial [Synergistaceae bacterium]|nr:hypothetical protein [Synergistaceae bacterium]
MAKKSESYYFPGHITEKLARIPEHPVTFVEAPSGFGKTTAIREYIRRSLPEAFSRWHICLGEPPVKTWSSVCGMFPDADGQTTERLRELGPPTIETIADVSEIVRNFRAPLETFLIVDNYQLFDCAARKQIVEAFSA